jgi:hypothetical protein
MDVDEEQVGGHVAQIERAACCNPPGRADRDHENAPSPTVNSVTRV